MGRRLPGIPGCPCGRGRGCRERSCHRFRCHVFAGGAKPDGSPLSVSYGGKPEHDTILWMDHRAIAETDECNAIDDPLFDRFGGRLSVEMQLPKLLWLKRHLPDTWARAGLIFDLSDFLTWRRRGSIEEAIRRLPRNGDIHLTARCATRRFLCADRASRPCREGGASGKVAFDSHSGRPLSGPAAEALGLTTACLVAPGLVDAYAGAVACSERTDRLRAAAPP